MYHLFVEGQTEQEIAEGLNAEGHRTDLNRLWTRATVHQVLTNEKYLGHNVYNRTSFKLKRRRVRNPPDMWVRADGAFAGVVQPSLFEAVRRIIQDRARRFSDDEMLTRLSGLLEQKGWLSGLVIDESEDMPSTGAYRSRFGSLLRAYQLIGYSPGRDYDYVEINRILRTMHQRVLNEAVEGIERAGGHVSIDGATDLLTLNGEVTTSVVIARCFLTTTGARRWKVRIDASLRPDITLAIRMDQDNREPLDYYLLPRIDVTESRLHLTEENGFMIDTYRCDSIQTFYVLASRTQIRTAA
jgi:hypothetical protein